MEQNKRMPEFRAWLKEKRRMAYGPAVGQVNSGWVYAMAQAYRDSDEVILMESTGLLDKNKKEIYEGDIIRGANGKLWVIEWFGAGWHINNERIAESKLKFGGINEKYSIDKWVSFHGGSACPVEVIGNLYENADLVNK